MLHAGFLQSIQPGGVALDDADVEMLFHDIQPAAAAVYYRDLMAFGAERRTVRLGAVFLLVSFAIFSVVKAMNSFRRKKEEEPAPEEPAGPTTEELLGEIRDLLKNK